MRNNQCDLSGLRLRKPVDVLVLNEEGATLETVSDTGKETPRKDYEYTAETKEMCEDSMELAKEGPRFTKYLSTASEIHVRP